MFMETACSRMHELGLRAVYYHAGSYPVLAAPGRAFTDRPEMSLRGPTPEELCEALEQPDVTLESLWARFADTSPLGV